MRERRARIAFEATPAGPVAAEKCTPTGSGYTPWRPGSPHAAYAASTRSRSLARTVSDPPRTTRYGAFRARLRRRRADRVSQHLRLEHRRGAPAGSHLCEVRRTSAAR